MSGPSASSPSPARSASPPSNTRAAPVSAYRRSSTSGAVPTSAATTCCSSGGTIPDTSVVLLYLETFGNPRKFTKIAREMARTKPIVAVKSGRTLAAVLDDPSDGLAAVWPADATADALLAQSGVIRVESTTRAVRRSLGCCCTSRSRVGRRVAVVCNSRGATTLAVDGCARAELEAARVETMTWEAGPDDYRAATAAALADDEVDAVLLVYAPPLHERRDADRRGGRRERCCPRGRRWCAQAGAGHLSRRWRRLGVVVRRCDVAALRVPR